MSSSAITTQVAQLKIGSVQNQADSTSVYSAGVWSFKNSTALTSVTIDNSGNVGIGTASPASKLAVSGTTGNGISYSDGTVTNYLGTTGSNLAYIGTLTNHPVAFLTNLTERMRIDASGRMLVGKSATGITTNVGHELWPNSPLPLYFLTANHATGTDGTIHVYNANAAFNGYRFYVLLNGGIANYSGNNVTLSDERTKTDIQVAPNYLEKICSIPVKTFRYKDQGDDTDLTLGVIAQDVEKVAPELVNATDGFGDIPEDGVPFKTVYQSDFQYALMKCIQELKEKNDALEARLAASDARIAALEAK